MDMLKLLAGALSPANGAAMAAGGNFGDGFAAMNPIALGLMLARGGRKAGPLAGGAGGAPPAGSVDSSAKAIANAGAGGGEPDADERGGAPDGDPDNALPSALRGVGPIADAGAPSTIPTGLMMAPAATPARTGVFDRIGDFVKSDRGRGALFRAGASMLSSGDVGRGMMEGANYVDQQKALDAAQAEKDRAFGLDKQRAGISQQLADQTGLYQAGELQNAGRKNLLDMLQLQEAIRKNQAGEALTSEEHQILQDNNIRTTSASLAATAAGERNNIRSNAQSDVNSRRSADASRYATDAGVFNGEENRAWAYGPQVTTKNYDDSGNQTSTTSARRPVYGQIKYGPDGQAYRLDPFTGRPVPVTPSTIVTRQGPLAQ